MRLAADENFNNNILRGWLRRRPDLDIVRVQDVGLSGAEDPDVLEWCAGQGRIALTHDRATMVAYALDRVERGEPMPGLIAVHDRAAIGEVLDDLVLIADCVEPAELVDRVWFVPLH